MSRPDLLPPPEAVVLEDVRRALAEDIGDGDATAALLPDQPERAYLLCKEDAVVAGRPWFEATHRVLDPQVRIEWPRASAWPPAPYWPSCMAAPGRW